MKQLNIRTIGTVGALIISLVVAGCGGGGGGYSAPPSTTPPPTTPPPTQAGGITGTGSILKPTSTSVVVNGTTFNATGAQITDDRNRTLAEIEDGMTGKVRGRTDGTAQRIEIENELRGVAQAVQAGVDPQRFTVNGTVVYVDSQTVYKNLANFGAINGGTTYVEVHGLRDSTGSVRATRIEALAQGTAGIVDEIRGTITATGTNTFTLNSAPNAVTVNYTGTTAFAPAGTCSTASLASGLLVEVHGSFAGAVFTATAIDCEDQEDSSFSPSSSDTAEVEGYVNGFTALTAEFQVGTRRVSVTSSTRYEDGSSLDLTNDVRVEAEGTVNASGVLVASKIHFKSARIVLEGVPSNVDVVANTLVVLGKTVKVNSLTKIDTRNAGGNSTSLADLIPGADCAEVRAHLDGADIVADEVKEQSSGGGCKAIVQARVTAKNDAARTLTMLGIDVNLSGGTVVFRDASDAVISAATFFGAINTTTGTVVKAKGSFSGANLLTGEEAELEN